MDSVAAAYNAASPYVDIASTSANALNAIHQGNIARGQYAAQAAQAGLQGRAQALRYAQQGNAVLNRSLEAQAMARARAAAGGIDPFSGSAQFVQELSSRDAASDLGLLGDNAEMARLAAATQEGIYRQAGREARRAGLLRGVTIAGEGVGRYMKLREPKVAKPAASGLTARNASALNTHVYPTTRIG
jgi:hypothetical protein